MSGGILFCIGALRAFPFLPVPDPLRSWYCFSSVSDLYPSFARFPIVLVRTSCRPTNSPGRLFCICALRSSASADALFLLYRPNMLASRRHASSFPVAFRWRLASFSSQILTASDSSVGQRNQISHHGSPRIANVDLSSNQLPISL